MRSLQLWKAIFALASIGSAQRLAFLTPSGGDPVLYTENHEIQLKWRSPWPLTTVEIWQGPRQDGSYNMKTLLANCTPEQTSASWRAAALDGTDYQSGFHFRLQKGDQPNLCTDCIATSPEFRIQAKPILDANPTPTKEEAGSPVRAQASATATATSTGTPGVSRKAELGAALGISITGGAIILAICILWGVKKYRRMQILKQVQGHPLEEEKLQYNLYQSSVRGSYVTTATAASGKAPSYIEPFEFEDEHGRIREGWYSLWGDGRPSRRSETPFRKSMLRMPRQALYR